MLEVLLHVHCEDGVSTPCSSLAPRRLSDGEEEGVSLSLIKSSVRSRLSRGGRREEGEEWSGSEVGESSDEGAERLLRAKDAVPEERGEKSSLR